MSWLGHSSRPTLSAASKGAQGKIATDAVQPWPATNPFRLMNGWTVPKDLLDRLVPASSDGTAA